MLGAYAFVRQRIVDLISAPFWARLTIFLLFSAGIIFRHNLFAMDRPGVDLLVSLGIGILTAFLAVLAGHVGTTNSLYRWMFYIGGLFLALLFVVNGIRSYLAAKAMVPVETIVMRAVTEANKHTDTANENATVKANEHTDTEVGMVRDDLKGLQRQADQQIAEVRGDVKDLKSTTDSLAGVLSDKLGKTIAAAIPPPPPPAKLEGGFFSLDAKQFPVVSRTVSRTEDDVYTLDFLFINKSTVTAKAVETWIVICEDCTYVKMPDGFDRVDGNNEQTRHRRWGDFNPGVGLPKFTAVIKLGKHDYAWFTVALRYSCDNCGTVATIDNLKTTIQ